MIAFHVFVDELQEVTSTALGAEMTLQPNNQETMDVALLVENQGRVNYGYKFNNPSQAKGIRGGVMQDIHFTKATVTILDFCTRTNQ